MLKSLAQFRLVQTRLAVLLLLSVLVEHSFAVLTFTTNCSPVQCNSSVPPTSMSSGAISIIPMQINWTDSNTIVVSYVETETNVALQLKPGRVQFSYMVKKPVSLAQFTAGGHTVNTVIVTPLDSSNGTGLVASYAAAPLTWPAGSSSVSFTLEPSVQIDASSAAPTAATTDGTTTGNSSKAWAPQPTETYLIYTYFNATQLKVADGTQNGIQAWSGPVYLLAASAAAPAVQPTAQVNNTIVVSPFKNGAGSSRGGFLGDHGLVLGSLGLVAGLYVFWM
ncbi:uncharacterized protein BJ171DRAFT_279159 [Polychytrium aggregatum]|uniref:uncharacterized protein n=1 Tax=Polychytrium aggregatum TaxID=110093 RepID=UPI0022FEA290|nr:uncharacterized protein BJ171DRAFT_279159 [Polychytrium aggregatum]KAI9207670.1 hypothetical protein BJ171DRAFT_279159 [Polychytrium aggregatum]